MATIPRLKIAATSVKSVNSQARLDNMAKDIEKLQAETQKIVSAVDSKVPAYQRQGYLEKHGHSRKKWFKRFFVLRDSMLLSYNLQVSSFTTEPRTCIHLGEAKIQEAEDASHEFCFSISTSTDEYFLFSASSRDERRAWMADLAAARMVTHANMVKLAVENSCLIEEKGLNQGSRDDSTSSLGIFCNTTYIENTPLTGGMEGWLVTRGFNPEKGSTNVFNKNPWKRYYFILRDSHLLMFNAGDILTKPRGAMYLVGTTIEQSDTDFEIPYKILVSSSVCGDSIYLGAPSLKQLNRWIKALTVGSHVTFPHYKLLEKERQILATLVLTPRGQTPRGGVTQQDQSQVPTPALAPEVAGPPPSVLDEEHDIQGNFLAPGAVQPYDENGYPLIRNEQGKLVNSQTGVEVPPTQPRFSSNGEQLDPFNRPLPPGSVPMFDKTGKPIGVGPDGLHYTADGEMVSSTAPHYSAFGVILPQEIVNAADAIASTISVAVKVRAKLQGDQGKGVVVDALGRNFKGMAGEQLVTIDGETVPTSARRVEVAGKLVDYEEERKRQEEEEKKRLEEEAKEKQRQLEEERKRQEQEKLKAQEKAAAQEKALAKAQADAQTQAASGAADAVARAQAALAEAQAAHAAAVAAAEAQLRLLQEAEEKARREAEELARAEAEAKARAEMKHSLQIKIQNEEGEAELGVVEIDQQTTLSDVRVVIASQLNVPKFAFLFDGVPLTKYEEANKFAVATLPEVTIRGADLTPQKPENKFATKAARMHVEQEQKKKEQEEFLNILNKVKGGQFLRSTQKNNE